MMVRESSLLWSSITISSWSIQSCALMLSKQAGRVAAASRTGISKLMQGDRGFDMTGLKHSLRTCMRKINKSAFTRIDHSGEESSRNPQLADSFDLEKKSGILVAQVTKGSPAAKAGLQEGDVITAYRGKPVTNVGGFRNRVSMTEPGSSEELIVIRGDKQRRITVTVGKLTEEEAIVPGAALSTEIIGLTVQTLTPQLADRFGIQMGEGVIVTQVRPRSIAAMAGVRTGSIIMQVNQKPVKTAAEFKQLVESGGKKRVLLLLRVGEVQQYLVLNW